MKPVLLLCGLLLITYATSQTPDPTPFDGKITGTVVDADGKPISGATVYVLAQSLSSITNAFPVQGTTDLHGRFDFGETLKHGIYDIYARKDKDGYPDPSSAFYRPSDFRPESAQLFGEHPEARVEVKLGIKQAW
jgi:carboxypeptidase family protein